MDITQLWRYPVKSMIGEVVDAVEVDELGVVGDRTWAARDLERGGIRGAKKIAGLMRLSARATGDGHAEITLPDGSTVCTTDSDVDEAVSTAVEHPVRLESLRPPEDSEHYRRGPRDADDAITELRAIFGREEGEPLPDFSMFPAEMNEMLIEFESPPGTYYDAFPLMVMSEQALESLATALPDSRIDVRRFRPSIVVDADGEAGEHPGHPEFGWVGRTARIGTAAIEFAMVCPRCIMVTREIDSSVPQDRAVLRHVVRELGQNVGVYATVVKPGVIRTGDTLTFV